MTQEEALNLVADHLIERDLHGVNKGDEYVCIGAMISFLLAAAGVAWMAWWAAPIFVLCWWLLSSTTMVAATVALSIGCKPLCWTALASWILMRVHIDRARYRARVLLKLYPGAIEGYLAQMRGDVA